MSKSPRTQSPQLATRLQFTAIATLFAMTIELEYKLFARFNPAALAIALPFYLIYLQLGYCLHQLLNRFVKNSVVANLMFFVVMGLLGGIGVEWFIVGNSPWGNPNANQFGMFVFHAVYPFMGRLFIDHREFAAPIKRRIWRYYLGFIGVSLLGLLIPVPFLRFVWFIYFPIVAYLGLCYFIGRYSFEAGRSPTSTP